MSETPREIAERIVKEKSSNFSKDGPAADWMATFREADITSAIEAALNAERERAAKIALTRYTDCLHCQTASKIADRIRGKD